MPDAIFESSTEIPKTSVIKNTVSSVIPNAASEISKKTESSAGTEILPR